MNPSLFVVSFACAVVLVAVRSVWPALPETAGDEGAAARAGAQFYERYIGDWDAEVEMMGQTSKGRETCSQICGGAWLMSEFHGEFMGQPYEGRGLNQFEAASQAHVGVWADSSGAPLTRMEGGVLAKDGNTLVAHANTFDQAGKPARCRYTTRFEGEDRRNFVCEIESEAGRFETMMTIRYRRVRK